ncbi:unnamed protein product [Somion occarium]|uniref:Glycoside hydrolase family 95 protein n=1 Tax=Somion occarium TaxID=3059160 RepID=A0ABP1DSM0_9APHY
MSIRVVLVVASTLSFASSTYAAPPGFPSSGNGLWYKTPGSSWSKEWLPIGNGYLAAMTPGGTVKEVTQLNIESLWSGGPFQDPTYNGGNKQPSERAATAAAMQQIRQSIFDSPSGTIDNVEELSTDPGAYGSYAGAGNLITTLNSTDNVTNYARWLDLDQAVAFTSWEDSENKLVRTSFCSNPSKSCTQQLKSSSILPEVTYAFDSGIELGLPQPVVSCFDHNTLILRGSVVKSQMTYEFIGRVNAAGASARVNCTPTGSGNATIIVSGASTSSITWVGATDYDMDAGNAAHSFSFKGNDPHSGLVATLNTASPIGAPLSSFTSLMNTHVKSYQSFLGGFSLSLGQKVDLTRSTDELVAAYQTDVGDTYLEWLLFNYGRYLLTGSAPGVLPANLQGKWARDISNPWSADYHSNINIQMNYWFAEMTNMNLVTPLFDYIEKTWAPRGTLTAQVLYNITRGWVTHNEIFGHTGMKLSGNSAQWANYPESAVWMMIHVWDHFDYTNNLDWFKAQGWPLLKGVASFHLDKLIPDLRFNDSSLVVSPCNSPEQVPITLGCAHAQQLIWQLFNAIEKGFPASGDTDTAFLAEVRDKRVRMDKGIHIGSWGQLQEWKVDMDSPSDTHRHLSHLIGLYPGYAVSGYEPSLQGSPSNATRSFTKAQVLDAATTSLAHRGIGTGPDADAGWEKVWRAAAWAQLRNASQFYFELSYAIKTNYGANLLSLYTPDDVDPIFQIDANFGYPAALLNGLLQAPDVPSLTTPIVITVLPALPDNWPSGSIKGARVRGGLTVDFQWTNSQLGPITIKTDTHAKARPIQVVYKGKTLSSFNSSPGSTTIVRV